MTDKDPIERERLRRRTMRNWGVFLALLLFVALIYAITIVKIKAGMGA